MSAAEQNEIKNRLKMACERADLAGYRARLASASRSHYPQAADPLDPNPPRPVAAPPETSLPTPPGRPPERDAGGVSATRAS